jgi:hypothetical protein
LNPRLANIDLRLYEVDDGVLGTVIEESHSTIDNVEHIYRENIAGGSFAIEVISDEQWEYALAWQTVIETNVPGDANFDGEVDGLDYLIWAEHFGEGGATVEQGDFNDDTMVEGLDYLVWADGYGVIASTVLPEPATSALVALGWAVIAFSRRPRRSLRPCRDLHSLGHLRRLRPSTTDH